MIRNAKDFWIGLIYIFFGSSAILIARDYNMGTAIKMGPAYFPTILGGLLLADRQRTVGTDRWCFGSSHSPSGRRASPQEGGGS